jgi:acyl carrier protein
MGRASKPEKLEQGMSLPDGKSNDDGRAVKYEKPRNALEQALAEIWAGVLRLESIGVHDNFFEIGGHSLLAVKIISRIYDLYGVEPPLESLFESPTIAGLARSVEQCLAVRPGREGVESLLTELEQLSDEDASATLAGNIEED